jgi:hypothetical protein
MTSERKKVAPRNGKGKKHLSFIATEIKRTIAPMMMTLAIMTPESLVQKNTVKVTNCDNNDTALLDMMRLKDKRKITARE